MSDSLSVYCRFCAEQKHYTEITNLDTQSHKLDLIIEKLSVFVANPIEFHLKHLPETICSQCFDSLNNTYEFYNKIKASQISLLNLISYDIKGEIFDENAEKKKSELMIVTVKQENLEFEDLDSHFTDFEPNDEDRKSIVTWESYSCFCKYCEIKLDNLNTLKDHLRKFHDKCAGFYCVECGLDFNAFYVFVAHLRTHVENLRNFCEYCNIKLSDKDHIKQHMSKIYCEYCGETFLDKKSLQTHLKLYSSNEVKRKKFKKTVSNDLNKDLVIESWDDYPWICRFCSKQMEDQKSLREHVKAHGRCFGVKCSDCNDNDIKTFSKFVQHVICHRSGLKSYCPYCNIKIKNDSTHLETHKSEYQCTNCDDTFQDIQSLENHTNLYKKYRSKRIYTQDDLTCKVCKKVAKSANNLHDHMKVHEVRTRDFSCDRCGLSFYTKGNLKNHIIIHENPEPQICKICNKSFLTLIRLRKHLVSHNSAKPFSCPECNRTFRIKKYLKSHMVTHGTEMPFTCQYCDKKFRFRGVLKVHERQHTGTRPYFCEVCNKDFFSWSNCDKHLRRMHGITLAKTKLTPEGRIPINPKSMKPKKLEIEDAKEWSEQVMVHRKRGKKSVKNEQKNTQSVIATD